MHLRLNGANEVAIVASPIAREQTHRTSNLVGAEDPVEPSASTSQGNARPKLSFVEHACKQQLAVGAKAVERSRVHRERRQRKRSNASWPAFYAAFDGHVAEDLREGNSLCDEVVVGSCSCAETIHYDVERTRLHRENPARVVGRGEIAEWLWPRRGGGVDAAYARVKKLSKSTAVVDGEQASTIAAGVIGLAPKQREEAGPVGSGPTFESNVAREHAANLTDFETDAAPRDPTRRSTRRLRPL